MLQLPEGATIPERPLPEGYAVRAATASRVRGRAGRVQEDAFLEWSEREREHLRGLAGRDRAAGPGFEPWNLRVVTDPAGEVVAHGARPARARTAGFIARLADPQGPARPRPGPGPARRRVRARPTAHGATRSELSTDSRTGALGLYEKVGMRVSSTWVNRAIDV